MSKYKRSDKQPNNGSTASDLDFIEIPHLAQIEQSLLGAILLTPGLINQAASDLAVDDFYLHSNRLIFAAMIRLFRKDSCLDLALLSNELSASYELEKIGGMAHLATLLDGSVRDENITDYIKLLRESATRRRLLHATNLIQTLVNDPSLSLDEVIERAEKAIFDVQKVNKPGFRLLADIVSERLKELEDPGDKATGIPSGFPDLDRFITGWRPGQMITVAARPGAGKTAFGLSVAFHAAAAGYKVGKFSLEMSGVELADRALASLSKIDSRRLRSGNLSRGDWSMLAGIEIHLASCPIYINEDPDLTITDLKAQARRLKAEHGLDLLIVDYLQLLEGDEDDENRQQAVARISRAMKKTAKDLNIPLIALSQLSRAVEQRPDHHPQLSDLRDSGAIEQDSDLVLFLYRPELYSGCAESDKGITEVIIGKQRNGPMGAVRLRFKPEFTRFEDLEPGERD